jgi:hypothetical protein
LRVAFSPKIFTKEIRPMTPSMSDFDKRDFKKCPPVMPCHPAEEGGVPDPLVRGAAPSTPRHGRKEIRRMSIKKFFRVTPEENILIVTNAADAGLEASSYMRTQILGKSKVRKARRIRADWKELQRCMGVINMAGNVVNQFILLLRHIGGNSEAANGAFADLSAAAHAIIRALRR